MGPKKKEVDMTNLPKVNTSITSLILNFENPERRFKILENIFKNPHRLGRLITRESIIEYAKETKIFVEPVENKKDPNPPEKRDINSEELAKAFFKLLQDKSVPFMVEKKAFLDKIEETKKLKEDAIAALNNPLPVKPKPGDKKKQEPVNPDDIIIPELDNLATEFIVILYNYPLNNNELTALQQENVILNHVLLLKEIDEFVEEPKEEVVAGKKPAPVKDVKPSNEILLMQKHFHVPTREPDAIFQELLLTKYRSSKKSPLRFTFFEKMDFSYKINEETKKDTITSFQDDYISKMNMISRSFLHYLNWSKDSHFEPLGDRVSNASESQLNDLILQSNLQMKDFEHISSGSILFAFSDDIIRQLRDDHNIKEDNEEILQSTNDIDDLFSNIERDLINENKLEQNLGNENNSHVQQEAEKESEGIEKQMINADELSSPFKLVIDEKDFILKSCLENKIEDLLVAEKEKVFMLFRKFPGIGRHEMPELSPKEENYRKAKKCEVYPFLDDSIGIPIYEKYQIVSKFEEVFREAIPEQPFDFGDRVYQEPMNQDILIQTMNYYMLYDTESIFYYNERDDNLLFSNFYRCPKGRVYRKTNKYRYLSKPDFENWVKYFKPTFADGDGLNTLNKEDTQNPVKSVTSPSPHNVIPVAGVEAEQPKIEPKFEKQPTISLAQPFDDGENVLYEADDICLGEVTEKVKYMFPSDNSVIIKKVIENGIFSSFSSYVLKDNLIFGIRKNHQDITEFWIRFDNDVNLSVSYIGQYDSTFENYDNKNGTYTNVSFKNGLNVQVMPNGDICQKIIKLEKDQISDAEQYRIITSKASVIRYFQMEKSQIMYATGNVCTIQNGLMINTNNKGNRIAKKVEDMVEYEMDPIPITIQSDPESNSKI